MAAADLLSNSRIRVAGSAYESSARYVVRLEVAAGSVYVVRFEMVFFFSRLIVKTKFILEK